MKSHSNSLLLVITKMKDNTQIFYAVLEKVHSVVVVVIVIVIVVVAYICDRIHLTKIYNSKTSVGHTFTLSKVIHYSTDFIM